MAAIDKKAFLARIASKKPAGDALPGEGSEALYDSPAESTPPDGGLSCGEQLIQALDSGDPAAVDAALQEAVAKYSSRG